MNFAENILYGVINNLMLKFVQTFVRFQGIGEDGGTRNDMLTDFRLKRVLLAVRDNLNADLSATFQDSHNSSLILTASASDFLRANVRVHVAGFSADEGFVGFNLTGEFVAGAHAQAEANAVIHEPRGSLCDLQRPRHLATAHAILAIGNQPRGSKPFIQPKRRVFVNRSSLQGIFLARV